VRSALLLALGLTACRTEITPVLVREDTAKKYKLVTAQCEVQEYPRGDEVPPGASNIGWLQVDREATDEATFEQLRLAVCAKGGTAFSQARWLRHSGTSVTEPPFALEANAWLLAEPKER
jgi:hypothetical protein